MARGIIYIDGNYAEFGTFDRSYENIYIWYNEQPVLGISYEKLKEHLGFDYAKGYYVIGKDCNQHVFTQGRDKFPYNLDRHNYNTKFAEHLFTGKQHLQNHISFKYINELPYTFGLEFETAGGFIPQHQLYDLGLIPLRDGSITGIEFSTVVLQGNSGLNLLKQQLEILNQHTIFDKDCSLHIHLGNFKLDGQVLLAINNLFRQCGIKQYLPRYSFETFLYKTNANKNYCELNLLYSSFDEMYISLVNRNFFGDFTQPHPKDLSGTRKWNIASRYKAVNFINAICYNGPKTVEYRMLRPTYNFEKILGWLFIYGAIIKYAERNPTHYRIQVSLKTIIKCVYSAELANLLCNFLDKNAAIVKAQNSVFDYYGMRTDIDDKLINYNTFGKYFY